MYYGPLIGVAVYEFALNSGAVLLDFNATLLPTVDVYGE